MVSVATLLVSMTILDTRVPLRYPRRVEGRKAVAELYRPYGTMIVLVGRFT
jgi:hypothetical protein